MRKIALFTMMLLLPCVSFTGLLNSNSPTTPISRKYKQQLMGSPVYIEILRKGRMLDLYVKMGEICQLPNSYRICSYSGSLGPRQRQGDLESPEGFYSVTRSQFEPNSRFYKTINISLPNTYDRAHGYEGKYLIVHGDCVSVGCYAVTDSGIDEIFQSVTGALVFGQPSMQVSIYPSRMADANMERYRYPCYAGFWKQLRPGYDYLQQTHKPPIVLVTDDRYVVGKPLSYEVVQPQLASNYTLPEIK